MKFKPQRSRWSGRREGFSIIEIIVVIGIMMIIAGTALPNIMGYIRLYSVRAGANQVTAELQKARFQAIRRNANWGLVLFITGRNQYRMYSEDVVNKDTGQLFAARQAFDVSNNHNSAEPPRLLPVYIEFVPVGADGKAFRFDRMGRVCTPTATTVAATCPQPQAPVPPAVEPRAVGGGPDAHYIEKDASGNYIVRVEDIRTRPGGINGTAGTGITRTITITKGGRIVAQR